jgi:hypothetical protein
VSPAGQSRTPVAALTRGRHPFQHRREHPDLLGIPSLTIGAGGKGEGAHSLAESWDSAGSEKGTQWVLLLVLGLAGVR